MANSRKLKAKLPAPVEAWGVYAPWGDLLNTDMTRRRVDVKCCRDDRVIRVRIVPIARKRRRAGK